MIVLKKEVSKTNNASEQDDMDKYRQLLVRGLHSLSVKFPDIASSIIPSKLIQGSFKRCQSKSNLNHTFGFVMIFNFQKDINP